jgi:hypothetical protein
MGCADINRRGVRDSLKMKFVGPWVYPDPKGQVGGHGHISVRGLDRTDQNKTIGFQNVSRC